MKLHSLATTLLLLGAGAALATTPADPHDHHEHHDHGAHAAHAEAALELDGGRRWQTDAPLREGMQRIRDASQAAQADPARTAALPDAIDGAIAHMVRHCQLPAKADATLHVLLGRLGNASAALRQDPRATEALAAVEATLELYPRYFEHPDWAPEHAH
jgi:hypothetical protein